MLHNYIYLLANDLYHTLQDQEFSENPDLEFQPIWDLKPEYRIDAPKSGDGYIPCLDLYLRTVKSPTSRLGIMLVRSPTGKRKTTLLSGILNNLLSNPGKVLGIAEPLTYKMSVERLPGLTTEQTSNLIAAIESGRVLAVIDSDTNLDFATPWYRLPNRLSVGYSYMTTGGRINHTVLLEQPE